jgi:hypothetical protein
MDARFRPTSKWKNPTKYPYGAAGPFQQVEDLGRLAAAAGR